MGEMIEFQVENESVEGYLAMPEGAAGPGVLLLHAWWGLNDFIKRLAERLAGEGFVVLAPDLYGGRMASTVEEAEALSGTLDYKEAIKHVAGGADYLLSQPRVQKSEIGVVGFSLGAAYATWLATLRQNVGAVVIFYGGVEQGEDFAKETSAAFLGHFAENDQYESAEVMREFEEHLKTGGREAAFYVYIGTGHWFFENDRQDVYDADAAELAWERTVEFLHSHLE